MVSGRSDGSKLSTGHFSWTRPDPTRRNVDPTRDCRQKVWPDPTRPAARPFPNMYSLQLNNYIYQLVNYYIKYRRKSINPNLVFEDSHRFRYQEIISRKLKNPKCWPDPPKSGKIVTRPDPTRGSIRPVDNSGMDRSMIGGWIYSKSVGWLVCMFADQSIGIMDGQWLACRLFRSLFGLSVSRSNHPAGLLSKQPLTDRPPKHPSTGPWPNNQSLNFRYLGSTYTLVSVRPVGCGRAAWPMPANYWSSLMNVSSSL